LTNLFFKNSLGRFWVFCQWARLRYNTSKYIIENLDKLDRKEKLLVSSTFKTSKSEEIFAAAQKLMPGGVNSPVRAFKSVGGQPIVFDRVQGAYIWDVDGNQYIDYVGTWGPAICGHAHPEVIAALHEALDKGTSFGAPCRQENILAEMVIEAVPSIEMVRFVNSGTEACMSVLRLIRAFTGRNKVIKFEGCYHGHADMFLVKAGSGVATLGLPDSPGVPKTTTSDTLTAPFNDLEAVKALFAENPQEIAGVILEPVVGNAGFIPPDAGFLEGLRELTQEHGALLVFDEVMTGFRIAYGGAQAKFGVTPDLTTLGKVIGGGLPVGAYGGRKDIMSMVAPAGPMYQAGTLSGNPLAMTAGIKTLELLQKPGTYDYLARITKKLADGLVQIAQETGHAACGGNISAMFGLFFTAGPVRNYEDAKKSDLAKFSRFHRGMLERGIYLAPSQFEAGFSSLAHTEEDIERTLDAARAVLSSL
jgi:glutamate-1-semialdehyde 2,1-aminomutase